MIILLGVLWRIGRLTHGGALVAIGLILGCIVIVSSSHGINCVGRGGVVICVYFRHTVVEFYRRVLTAASMADLGGSSVRGFLDSSRLPIEYEIDNI